MLRQVYHGPDRGLHQIRRCLKGTLARQLYRLLEHTATNQPAVDAK